MIDIETTLRTYGIHFVTAGSNVAAHHINIKCPWCSHDPSEHLGIDLRTGMWGCWRDPAHRGRSLNRLLYKLHIPTTAADKSQLIYKLEPTVSEEEESPKVFKLPEMFVPIRDNDI